MTIAGPAQSAAHSVSVDIIFANVLDNAVCLCLFVYIFVYLYKAYNCIYFRNSFLFGSFKEAKVQPEQN